MKLAFPQFTTRELLGAMTVIACALAIATRARQIHNAATFIESHGGDVWCSGRLYTGSEGGLALAPTHQKRRAQASIVCQVLLGARTELWVCYVPEDRERFADSLALLNAQKIRFDVLGPSDFDWIRDCRPGIEISAVDGLKQNNTQPAANAEISDTAPQTVADFLSTLEAVEEMLAEDPQWSYRLDRYETLIGYPEHGEMGRARDKLTGRVIYLPWPQ